MWPAPPHENNGKTGCSEKEMLASCRWSRRLTSGTRFILSSLLPQPPFQKATQAKLTKIISTRSSVCRLFNFRELTRIHTCGASHPSRERPVLAPTSSEPLTEGLWTVPRAQGCHPNGGEKPTHLGTEMLLYGIVMP